MPYEGEPGNEPIERELRSEHAESLDQLRAVIKGELIEGAEEALKNGHVDRIVVRDQQGRTYEHVIDRPEVENIDRALWSAGEDMTLEQLVSNILGGIREAGLEVSDPAHLQLDVRLIEDTA